MTPLKRIRAKSKVTDNTYILWYKSIYDARKNNPAFIDFEYL